MLRKRRDAGGDAVQLETNLERRTASPSTDGRRHTAWSAAPTRCMHSPSFGLD